MEAAAADVHLILGVCQANPQEQQVFVVRERLDNLADYAELTTKEVADFAAKFERRTVADGRIVIPAKVVKNIQVLCFWAREKVRAGQPLVAAQFTPAALPEAKESMRLRDETQREAPSIKPDKFNPLDWTEWSKHFVTYLSHTKGVQFAPLDYVVHQDPPPGPIAAMNARDQALYDYPLVGRHFQEDNMTVYWLLSDLLTGTMGFCMNPDIWPLPKWQGSLVSPGRAL